MTHLQLQPRTRPIVRPYSLFRLFSVFAAGVLGCGSPTQATTMVTPEVLLSRPHGFFFQLAGSTDGVLFASSDEGVLRTSDPLGPWDSIGGPPEVITGMYAPSRDTLFAITRGCAAVYRWVASEGWREMQTPVSDSTWVDGHFEDCVRLLDIWGREGSDVYVTGSRGVILHFNGEVWSLEATPLAVPFGERGQVVSDSFIWSISGDAAGTYAVGGRVLRKLPGERWKSLKPQLSSLPPSCRPGGTAVHRGVAYFASNDCVLRLDDGTLEVERYPVNGLTDDLWRGRTQNDSTAVFWSYNGDILDFGSDMPAYGMVGIGAVGGVVALNGFVYAAGSSSNGGLVVRVARERP